LLLTAVLITSAQDYVDVEAERRAEEAAQNGAVVTPAAPMVSAPAASTYSGIRPYSGTTTVAQVPADVTASPITGDDSGSMVN
jgi:hypothetical protein